jgi:hypothetical protein
VILGPTARASSESGPGGKGVLDVLETLGLKRQKERNLRCG